MSGNIIDITGRLKAKKPVAPVVDRATKRAAAPNPLQIREWRHQRGLSRSQLAMRMGVATGYIAKAEDGHYSVSAARLVQFAEALDVEVGDLFKAPPAQTASPRV